MNLKSIQLNSIVLPTTSTPLSQSCHREIFPTTRQTPRRPKAWNTAERQCLVKGTKTKNKVVLQITATIREAIAALARMPLKAFN